MKMRRLLTMVVLMTFILALVLGACAQSSPSPQPKELLRVELLTSRPADAPTVLTYALSSYLNDDSKLVRSSVIPTGGFGDARSIFIEQKDKRNRYIVLGNVSSAFLWRQKAGVYPLFIAAINDPAYTWITYDSKIKTLEDLAGKNLAGPREDPGWWDTWAVALKAAGVFDKVKLKAMGMGAATTALTDGTADVAWTSLDYIYPNIIEAGSAVQQASVRGPVYFVDWGKDRIEKDASKAIGWQLKALEIPAGALGKTQPNAINIMVDPTWWGAGPEMDNETVYEITKIIWEHAGKGDFGNYHNQGKGMVQKYVPYGVWKTREDIEKWYHPGALKFYRDMKVPGL